MFTSSRCPNVGLKSHPVAPTAVWCCCLKAVKIRSVLIYNPISCKMFLQSLHSHLNSVQRKKKYRSILKSHSGHSALVQVLVLLVIFGCASFFLSCCLSGFSRAEGGHAALRGGPEGRESFLPAQQSRQDRSPSGALGAHRRPG